MRTNLRTFAFNILLLFPLFSYATIFEAQSNGNWNDPSTWGTSSTIPSSSDTVIIDGFTVEINETALVKALSILIDKGSNHSILRLSSLANLYISNDLYMESGNANFNVEFSMQDTSRLNLNGNLIVDRKANNLTAATLKFIMNGYSNATVLGNFKYFYRSAYGENDSEIEIYDHANLTVNQATELSASGGNTFTTTVYGNAKVNLQGGLKLLQSTGSKTINFFISGDAEVKVENDILMENDGGLDRMRLNILGGTLTVTDSLKLTAINSALVDLNVMGSTATLDLNGDLIFNADAADLVEVEILNNANFHLSGTIIRNELYGDFNSKNGGTLHLDGEDIQIIPGTAGAGTDSLDLGEVVFANTAGIRLVKDFIVRDTMDLSAGIIYTSDTALLIIADGAGISAGSNTAYVDGPLIKRGSTNGNSLLLPLGNNGTYAPIRMNAVSSSDTEYKGKYTGCPPPVGIINAPLVHILQKGYWDLERTDGAPIGNIELHWDDAAAWGIDDTSKLVVARFDAGTGWTSMGRNNPTGATGDNAAGAISNDIGCPPPVGSSRFTFGSTDAFTNLNVELLNFSATKDQRMNIIYLNWETASEENSSHFILQKSFDGIRFQNIANIPAAVNSLTNSYYDAQDNDPKYGNNYYRIMMVDREGMMQFSKLINVFVQEKAEKNIPIIFPNPVKDQIHIHSEDLASETTWIQIYDTTGKKLYLGKHQAFDGQISFNLSGINLKNGNLYYITYTINGLTQTITFQRL